MSIKTPQFTFLRENGYTFVLATVERPKSEPQPNFKGSGRALVAVMAKDTFRDIKRSHEPRKPQKQIKWSKVDASMIGTTVII